jgi:hypothetical protein
MTNRLFRHRKDSFRPNRLFVILGFTREALYINYFDITIIFGSITFAFVAAIFEIGCLVLALTLTLDLIRSLFESVPLLPSIDPILLEVEVVGFFQ